jgi:hypothetical protein
MNSATGETVLRPMPRTSAAEEQRPAAPAGSWAVPMGNQLVPLDSADATMLLTSASGLARALVRAGEIALAIEVTNAYLRMSADHGDSPIAALTHVQTSARAFSGVCITEGVRIHVERESLDIDMRLVRSIAGSRIKKRWLSSGRSTIELIDGSSYKHVEIKNPRLSILTVLGCQNVDVAVPGVTVRGHSVRELSPLRDRLKLTLDRHRHAFLKTLDAATFERFFRRAA